MKKPENASFEMNVSPVTEQPSGKEKHRDKTAEESDPVVDGHRKILQNDVPEACITGGRLSSPTGMQNLSTDHPGSSFGDLYPMAGALGFHDPANHVQLKEPPLDWSNFEGPKRNVEWKPDDQDLIYTAINFRDGEWGDADEDAGQQIVERVLAAWKSAAVTEQLTFETAARLQKERDAVEAARAEEWRLRRDAEGSRDAARAAAASVWLELDELRQPPPPQTNVSASACVAKLERLTSNTGRDHRTGQEFVHAGSSQETVDAMREALALLRSPAPQDYKRVTAEEHNAAFDSANEALGGAFMAGFREGWIYAEIDADGERYQEMAEEYALAVDSAPQEAWDAHRAKFFAMLPLAAVPEVL
ncbi:hypothetical protein [Neorhizobium sp. DAR64861/K0K2]|uniref:hypothetical protein n=1 Tax=unclassified Neorhizobium TaxID=2629175 RepID=UPI003D2A0163